MRASYHHGDLRNALLKAAEQQLRDNGVEKLTLRSVAREAGVSHAAPAHHFGDMQGLLTALAVTGFTRFLKSQQRKQNAAGNDPVERRVAAGLAYIEFSERNPQLFHLMFSSQQTNKADPALQQASADAFNNLVMLVNAVNGIEDAQDTTHITDVYATWAMVHGLSSLLSNGRLHGIKGGKKKKEAMLKEILLKNLKNQ
ncbi:MAG: TetR/AcrR family transcriptional regulator [Pseudomonadota bacterium]